MSRGITRSAPSDRSGSAALALTVGISLSMAVGGVFLMRTTNQSLKAVILAEKETELINYAKKKAMLTGVTTPSPCATQTPLPSFTPDSDDPTQEWRCFTTPSGTGTETILQARKATAAAPDAPPLVVTVTVPRAATAATVVTPTCSVHSGGDLVGTQAAADAAIYDKNDSTSCFGGGMSNSGSQTVITATLQFAAPITQIRGIDALAWRAGNGIVHGSTKFRVQTNGSWSSPMEPDSSTWNGSYSNPMVTYTKNGPWLNVSAIEIEVQVFTFAYVASSVAKIYEFRFW